MSKNNVQSRTLGSLADQAYLAIRERILRGQLGLGAVLSRRELAHELSMSMLPVCEAMRGRHAIGAGRDGALSSAKELGMLKRSLRYGYG